MTTPKAETIQALARAGSREAWESLYLAHARGEHSDLVPFPDEATQRLTNSAAGEDTARDAIRILDRVLSLARRRMTVGTGTRVLDYGCGWGRITRLLLRDINAENICGVDVDERLIASARDLLPCIDHRAIESMQALPLDADSFDLVFANSVFSHLSRASHEFTLAELARILKPGGVAVLSLLDETATRRLYTSAATRSWVEGVLGTQEALREILQKEGFHWGDTGRWHEYGLAVVTESWIAHTWPRSGLTPYANARGDHQRAQLFVAAQKQT